MADPTDGVDRYRNFKFRLKMDGRTVAGVSKVSGLSRTSRVITHGPGGDPASLQLLPSQRNYFPITLERGVTYDTEFQIWCNKIWDYQNSRPDGQAGGTGNAGVSLNDFRKDLILEVYNEAGQVVLTYNIYRAWSSEFAGMSDLDGMGNAMMIETLVVQNEGWNRDPAVKEPDAPGITFPEG